MKFSILSSFLLHASVLAGAALSWSASESAHLPLGVELMYAEASMASPESSSLANEKNNPEDVLIESKKKQRKPSALQAEKPQAPESALRGSAQAGATEGREGVANGIEVSPEDRYLYELQKLLERRKIYPAMARRMGQTGRVLVRFTLNKDGAVLASELVEKAAHESLNKAASELIRSIDGAKPFPQEITKNSWNITVPIEYVLN